MVLNSIKDIPAKDGEAEEFSSTVLMMLLNQNITLSWRIA